MTGKTKKEGTRKNLLCSCDFFHCCAHSRSNVLFSDVHGEISILLLRVGGGTLMTYWSDFDNLACCTPRNCFSVALQTCKWFLLCTVGL